MNRRILFASLAASLLCGILPGCGPRRPRTYPVEGRIAFANGEPVKLGTIEFRESKSGTVARGKIEPDGTFHITTFRQGDGALEGTHTVIVQQLIIAEDRSFKDHDHGKPVPRKYADYSTSGLSVVIKPIESNLVVLTLMPTN